MRKALAAAVLLLAVQATAGGIKSLSPSSIITRSGEHFLRADGYELGNIFVFDGPAGHFEVEAGQVEVDYSIAWVPLDIVNYAGTYSVYVTGRYGDSNRQTFTVAKSAGPQRLQLHHPEAIVALAKTRDGAGIRYEVSTTGGDAATTTIKCDPISGSVFPFGKSVITCIATDGLGERDGVEIPVTVWDGAAPSITVPESFEVLADDDKGAYVKYETSAYDSIDGALRVVCSQDSGTHFVNGRTRVDCEATDSSLNHALASFDVMVLPKDKGSLQLRLPDSVTALADSPEGAQVYFDVTAYGSADPDPVVECEPWSGWHFPMGRSKVSCVAIDDFGQRAEGGFTVEVVEKFALAMSDVSAEATSPSGASVSWEPTAEEWDAEIRCTPEPGSMFALGATSVDCSSTDSRGRRAEGTFIVNVADTVAPHIDKARAIVAALDDDRQSVQVAIDAIDAVDVMPRCSISTLTSDAGDRFDWRVKSDLEVEVAAGAPRALRIQISCVDASGNLSTETVPVALSGSTRRRTISR
jgi:hypothetical protein